MISYETVLILTPDYMDLGRVRAGSGMGARMAGEMIIFSSVAKIHIVRRI